MRGGANKEKIKNVLANFFIKRKIISNNRIKKILTNFFTKRKTSTSTSTSTSTPEPEPAKPESAKPVPAKPAEPAEPESAEPESAEPEPEPESAEPEPESAELAPDTQELNILKYKWKAYSFYILFLTKLTKSKNLLEKCEKLITLKIGTEEIINNNEYDEMSKNLDKFIKSQ